MQAVKFIIMQFFPIYAVFLICYEMFQCAYLYEHKIKCGNEHCTIYFCHLTDGGTSSLRGLALLLWRCFVNIWASERL